MHHDSKGQGDDLGEISPEPQEHGQQVLTGIAWRILRPEQLNVVPVGMEFQFKWKVDGEAATLDEVDGKDTDQVKARLEGDYAKKDRTRAVPID